MSQIVNKKTRAYFQVSLPVSILREGEAFVAYTPALDLSTSGKSLDEARTRFNEVVGIFFEELVSKGTLETVLSNLGWQRVRKEWVPPQVIMHQTEVFNMPVCVA